VRDAQSFQLSESTFNFLKLLSVTEGKWIAEISADQADQ
jgi:hypothetical protein